MLTAGPSRNTRRTRVTPYRRHLPTLLGDPENRPWTAIPETLQVRLTTLQLDERSRLAPAGARDHLGRVTARGGSPTALRPPSRAVLPRCLYDVFRRNAVM